MSTFRRCLLSAVLFLGIVATAAAQTTGGIVGRVTDEGGGVLPGVTVEAKSPALQGSRTAVTDGTGTYRLTLLPPGGYTVSFNLEGFAAESRQAVSVGLDKDTTLNVTLRAALSQEITVTTDVPVVDTTTTAVGANLDTRTIETLPTGRNYTSVVQITPGVSSDANPENTQQSSVAVYGSTGAENVYYIDGVNTTGAEYGFQGKELNFEFIQAVDVKTGGYQAEYGRSTGGVVNVITKSGGNEFHGDVFGYYDNDSLQSNAKPVVSTGGTAAGYTREDYGIDLGGFLVRDKLWFFGAYDKVDNTDKTTLPAGPLEGQGVDSKSKRNLGAAKLTWKLSESQSVVGSFFQDPRDDTGAINDAQHTLNGESLTYQGLRGFGGKDYSLRYQGILAASWLLTGQVAQHKEQNSIGPASGAGDVVQFRDVDNNFFQTGGFGLLQSKDFKRDSGTVSLTRYFANHEIKGGLEYEREQADVVRRFSGGQQIDVYSNGGRPVYSHNYWTTLDATVADAPVSQLTASPEHKNTAAYLQDRWTALPNLSIDLGLRWDRQEIIDASGVKRIDLKKDYAPRFGFVWDPLANGRSKLFGSLGRYYEEIPMDLVIRSFSFERQARIFNYSPTSTAPDPGAEADLGQASTIFGGATEPADPNLRNQSLTEALLGYEREVLPDLAVGVKGIYRYYNGVIEDFLCKDDGTYCIGNPGRGIMRRIYTLDYSQTFPAPKPKRTFKGIELDATKRFSNHCRGWRRISTPSWRGASTASTRRSPTWAPIRTSRRPTTTTTSSPTAATSTTSPTRGRCRTTAGTSSRSRGCTRPPGSSTSASPPIGARARR